MSQATLEGPERPPAEEEKADVPAVWVQTLWLLETG